MMNLSRPRFGPALLILPVLVFIIAIYVLPLADVLRLSVTEPEPTLSHYLRLASTPLYLRVLLNTFEIAFTISVIALILGYPLAYLLALVPPRLAGILMILVLVPFFTGVLVRNYAWIFMLGNNGVVNVTLRALGLTDAPVRLIYNRTGVIIASVHVLLPYMVLILFNTMRALDPRLMVAAGSLRAARFSAFRRVFLPLTYPAIGSAFILVFVTALAFFITPAMLGSARETMIAMLIEQQVGLLNWGFASALAAVLLATSFALLFFMQRAFGGFSMVAEKSTGIVRTHKVRDWRITAILDRVMEPFWPALPYLIGALTLVFLALPILIVLPLSLNGTSFLQFPPKALSFRWYAAILSDPSWMEAFRNSLIVGLMTVVFTMALAIPAALAITRSSARWVSAVYAVIMSPLVLPSIIIAISVFFLLSRIGMNGTYVGLALGHTIGALPIALVVLIAALRGFDANLDRAGASLRAGPLARLRRVTLPIIAPSAITAAFFAFLHSFDEVMITIFVAGIDTRTLPKRMWDSVQEISPIIPAVSSLLVLLSVAVVLVPFILGQRAKRGPTR
ncbi:ABC transporter permease subunit [Acuticoccus kandeliae]|uniref:ABC transporter permease subunit n=1 Tax=Acuticoccus kandeliae TaxID=2073160 RepID=UPI000D3E6F5B|nr:ABC transporter permease subunit [Acuticoccus kandeliae]